MAIEASSSGNHSNVATFHDSPIHRTPTHFKGPPLFPGAIPIHGALAPKLGVTPTPCDQLNVVNEGLTWRAFLDGSG
jgi:hypothetical protein